MKQVDVKDQVRLGLAKSFELCISGIKYRLFRSIVTVATVALAVAFLMAMLGQSVIRHSVQLAVERQTAPRHNYEGWLRRVSEPLSETELARTLWEDPRHDVPLEKLSNAPRLAELKTWSGIPTPPGQALTDAELQELRGIALREKRYLDYFARLEEGSRAMLLGADADRGSAIFRRLRADASGQSLRDFRANLQRVNPRMDTALEEGLERFMADYESAGPLRKRIIDGHREVIARLTADLGAQSPADAFAAGGPAEAAILRRHGFVLSDQELAQLAEYARLERTDRLMGELAKLKTVRAMLADRSHIEVSKVSPRTVWENTSSEEDAAALLRYASKEQPLIGLTPEQLVADSAAQAATRASPAGAKLAEWMRIPAVRDEAAAKLPVAADELTLKAFAQWVQANATSLAGGSLAATAAQELTDVSTAYLKTQDSDGTRRLEELVRLAAVRELVAGKAGVRTTQVSADQLADISRDAATAAEVLSLARQEMPVLALTPRQMADSANHRLRQTDLSLVEARLKGEQEGETEQRMLGFSRRTLWLIIVSFGVCAVGIANAMLMSVTERFREIATMKCLGAMDGFIMLLFVLESCLQGITGGIAGALVGAILGLLMAWWEFGGLAFSQVPGMHLLAAGGVSLVSGMLLAALAAVYPAWVASRLAPMEAMRVE